MAINHTNKQQIIDRAVAALERGGMVVYPADTVYGIAVDATNRDAVRKLDALKDRRLDQKYSYNFADVEMVKKYHDLTENQESILKKYLPGPFTFVLSNELSVRIPKGSIINEIVAAYGKPTTATSANQTGRPPATSIRSLDAKIYLAADLLIEYPEFTPQKPSTVVDISADEPKIIRQGELPFP